MYFSKIRYIFKFYRRNLYDLPEQKAFFYSPFDIGTIEGVRSQLGNGTS